MFQDELTAEDITYVGVPVRTEDGAVLVAFFAEAPSGGLVEGSVLARILEDNRNDISDAVRGGCLYGAHTHIHMYVLIKLMPFGFGYLCGKLIASYF